MCPSRLIKLALMASVLTMLASCGSIPVGDPQADGTDKTDIDKGSPETGEGVQANSLLAFQGKDPMADIQINTEIKQAYAKVSKYNASKDYPNAIKLLMSIKQKYPQLSGPDYQLARIYFSQKKLDRALSSVNVSLTNNTRNYYSLNLKGVILREQGEFEEAKAVYLEAIDIYPPYPNSHLNLGVLADIYMRDLKLALLQYQQYQQLTGTKDKKVANWILEIERRIKAGG